MAIHVDHGLVEFVAASVVPASAKVKAGRCMVARLYFRQSRDVGTKQWALVEQRKHLFSLSASSHYVLIYAMITVIEVEAARACILLVRH